MWWIWALARAFLAFVLAAFGHRVRGYDLAEGQLSRAREFAARVSNPPAFALGDAIEPPLAPASVDVIANRNIGTRSVVATVPVEAGPFRITP